MPCCIAAHKTPQPEPDGGRPVAAGPCPAGGTHDEERVLRRACRPRPVCPLIRSARIVTGGRARAGRRMTGGRRTALRLQPPCTCWTATCCTRWLDQSHVQLRAGAGISSPPTRPDLPARSPKVSLLRLLRCAWVAARPNRRWRCCTASPLIRSTTSGPTTSLRRRALDGCAGDTARSLTPIWPHWPGTTKDAWPPSTAARCLAPLTRVTPVPGG